MAGSEHSERAAVSYGLENVLAFESKVAYIDGHVPELSVRGYDIADLAHRLGYEQMAYLLLNGSVPTTVELSAFSSELAAERKLPEPVLDILHSVPPTAHPMAVLRTAVSLMGALEPDSEMVDQDHLLATAKRLLAKLPTIVAAQVRIQAGHEPIAPHGPELGHAENYLYMVSGAVPAEPFRQAFDAALLLYAEHETNASTFACRVVVGTMSDYYSAIVAGIGAIKGVLHGGAIDDAMNMLVDIGQPDCASHYVDDALAARRKLPGFGHRVYRTGDPRAAELREMALKMASAVDDRRWFDIAIAAERRMAETKGIIPNVDYFAAPVLFQLGFPMNLMTNVVASARVAGWSAHIAEQYANNRLIRPRALYVGDRGRRLDGDD